MCEFQCVDQCVGFGGVVEANRRSRRQDLRGSVTTFRDRFIKRVAIELASEEQYPDPYVPMRSPNTITPVVFVSLSAKSPAMVEPNKHTGHARTQLARSPKPRTKSASGCRLKNFRSRTKSQKNEHPHALRIPLEPPGLRLP